MPESPALMTPPSQIAHYRIVSKLGEGGMGAVYRATDTKLNRDVAIKILPDVLANDPDYLARFTREAQVLASLNHPNIAAIYGVEDSAIVMELVEGVTLAERIERGAIPLEEAVPIARQVAEALEAAHEKGIIHRDLKPANVKITPDGVVKVLDFGLAKAAEPAQSNPNLTASPTLTLRATQAGVIMGTAAYMSPEQASGKPVDKRADIWSFGVLLAEMLTGRTLFEGETISHILAHVLTAPISLDRLPAATPVPVRALISRCLDRTLKNRLRDIGEARVVLSGPLTEAAAPAPLAPLASSRWPWVAALAVALLAGGVGWWRATRPPELQPLVRVNMELDPDLSVGLQNAGGVVAISPDGSRIAVTLYAHGGKSQLYTRLLRDQRLVALAGTEGASRPFFSPDSEWIGFTVDTKLKKTPAGGGAVSVICDAPALRGASWGDDGYIVFAPQSVGPLFRVSANGGTPEQLTKLKPGERTHRWPWVLPGSQTLLFTAHAGTAFYDDANIEAWSRKTGERKSIHSGGFSPRYLRVPDGSGRLFYMHKGTLYAAVFDAARLAISGQPVGLSDVNASGDGGGEYTIAVNGSMLFLPGKGELSGWVVMRMDSSGKLQPTLPERGVYYYPRFSPDGKRLAFAKGTPDQDLWVWDLERNTPLRLSFLKNANTYPVWMPDGKGIIFRSTDTGAPGMYWIRSDGGGEPVRLSDGSREMNPWSVSPDGKLLAYSVGAENGAADIYVAPLEGDAAHPKLGKPQPFAATPAIESRAAFSPDGRWLAYTSDETSRTEVVVRPYPGPGGRWQVSNGGGNFPRWSGDGKELLYESNHRVMAVAYSAKGDVFVAGKTREWGGVDVMDVGNAADWDLSPDGKQMVLCTAPPDQQIQPQSHLTFLFHFGDELVRRAGKQ